MLLTSLYLQMKYTKYSEIKKNVMSNFGLYDTEKELTLGLKIALEFHLLITM